MENTTVARMHSSGMHTAHLLTVSQHALHRGNVCPGGLPGDLHRGCLPRGCLPGVSAGGWVCLPRGSAWGCLPRRVSALGFLPGAGLPGRFSDRGSARGGQGFLSRGCVSQYAMGQTPTLWTDRHL